MPKELKYTLQISLNRRLIVIYTLYFHSTYSTLLSIFGKALENISLFPKGTQKHYRYTLQNRAYSKKHSTSLLVPMYSELFRANINLNIQL